MLGSLYSGYISYFTIGLSLIQPTIDQLCRSNYELNTTNRVDDLYFKKSDDLQKSTFELFHLIKDNVIRELDLINQHSGFSKSPIFNYEVDYSQYLARGHYTSNEKLQNYFKSSMWYGTMNFLLKDKIQTIAAFLIASKFSKSKKLRDKWIKIYSITAFYSGFSEGLGPYEYIKATNNLFKEADFFDHSYLTKEESISKIKAELVEFTSCKISDLVGKDCLEPAKGMRLMGQRFVPDSHVLNTLTGHNFTYKGNHKETTPFTMVHTGTGNTIRGFPRGLDVMATMLDSKNATEILCTLGDSNYKDYELSLTKLKQRFNTLDLKDWNKNLYWSWFYLLKALEKEYDIGYPTFMRSKSWQHKMLTTSLASWSQLRHDTILYAKQSFTIGVTNIIRSKTLSQSTLGYVEPVPDLYHRMRALAKMISNGLSQMNVLDEESKISLQNLESLLTEIILICRKELENKELSEKEYHFINNFPMLLNAIVDKVEDKSKKTTIVCDVHTDRNSEKVLEEATGYVKLIVVAFKLPNERILLGVGPVLSYYEFKQPMKSRLTDETWRELLSSDGSPKEPEWIYSFTEPERY